MLKKMLPVILAFTICSLALITAHRYLSEYNLRQQLRKEYIVVTLSTTPHRIAKIAPFLESILRQNITIQHIYLNIPHIFKRDNLTYQIPAWLTANDRITILRTTDYGPATKLLGLLEQVTLPRDAIIITLDDDIYYPKNYVMHLAAKASQHPNTAVGMAGAEPYYDLHGLIDIHSEIGLIKKYKHTESATILEGFAGVAYRTYFFDADIFEINNFPEECVQSDDIYFSFYLARKNIMRLTAANKYASVAHLKNYYNPVGMGTDALHNLVQPAIKHRACIAFLKNKFSNVTF
jgi:hypothetical protein